MRWIKGLRQQNRIAQRQVYQDFSPKLYNLCRRYLQHEVEIEEALSDAFVSIFKNIYQLNDEEKFEAWAKQITVNQCLAIIRKKKVKYQTYIDDLHENTAIAAVEQDFLLEEDLMRLLQNLPEGCKTVFNLYAIEGYTHKEIAEKLGVSIGTSKSQLNVARRKLQDLVQKYYYTKAN